VQLFIEKNLSFYLLF